MMQVSASFHFYMEKKKKLWNEDLTFEEHKSTRDQGFSLKFVTNSMLLLKSVSISIFTSQISSSINCLPYNYTGQLWG